MIPAGHRRFWRLFGISVLLHAAVFAAMQSPWAKPTRHLAPIVASFKPVAAAAPAADNAKGERRRETEPAPRVPQRPAEVPRKALAEKSRTAAQPVLQADKGSDLKLAAAPPAAVAAASASPAAETSPPAAPAAPAAALAAGQPGRPQSDALAGYRQRLSELFAGKQAYPRLAAMRGWEGEVRLRLKVARKGNLVSIALDHSSGFEVLDQNALAMVEAIAALPALPETLEGSEIQIVVPISYKLRKTT